MKTPILDCATASTITILTLTIMTLIVPVHGFHLPYLPFVAPTADCYQESNWNGRCETVIYHIPLGITYSIGAGIYVDGNLWHTCVQSLKGIPRNNSYTVICSFDLHGMQSNQDHTLSSEFVVSSVSDSWRFIQSARVFSIPIIVNVS